METGDDGGGGNKGRVLTNNLEQVQGRDNYPFPIFSCSFFFFPSFPLVSFSFFFFFFFFFFWFPCR